MKTCRARKTIKVDGVTIKLTCGLSATHPPTPHHGEYNHPNGSGTKTYIWPA